MINMNEIWEDTMLLASHLRNYTFGKVNVLTGENGYPVVEVIEGREGERVVTVRADKSRWTYSTPLGIKFVGYFSQNPRNVARMVARLAAGASPQEMMDAANALNG